MINGELIVDNFSGGGGDRETKETGSRRYPEAVSAQESGIPGTFQKYEEVDQERKAFLRQGIQKMQEPVKRVFTVYHSLLGQSSILSPNEVFNGDSVKFCKKCQRITARFMDIIFIVGYGAVGQMQVGCQFLLSDAPLGTEPLKIF